MKQIKENVKEGVSIILIGNKSDLEDRAVNKSDGEELSKLYQIPFRETSAKTG